METLLRDFRQSLRSLARRPALSAVVVALIALGTGLDVALFSVVRATLIRDLPFPEPDRLVVLTGTYTDQPWWSLGVPELRDLDERSRVFDEIGIYSSGWPLTRTGAGEADSLDAGYASASFFTILGTPPLLGRTFTPAEDDGLDAHPVAVLSYRFWQQEMAADSGVLGQKLELGGRVYEVVGVLPEEFRFADLDLWLPLSMGASAFSQRFYEARGARFHFGVARLDDADRFDEARQEMDALMADLEREWPTQQRDRGVRLFPLREYFYGSVEGPVKLLFAGAALVLLICCVNIGALFLVRAISRRREMAVRAALGASRRRLAASFVTESLALTALGGVLGIVLAQFALGWVTATMDLGLPSFTRLELDQPALFTALGLILVLGLVLGIYPALANGFHHPARSLHGGAGQAGTDRRTARRRSLIIAVEVGLALMLLVGSGLTAKSFLRLLGTDLGYDTRDLVTVRLDLRGPQFTDEDPSLTTALRWRFAEALKERVEGLPGVKTATVWGPAMLGAANMHWVFAPEGADDFDQAKIFCQRLNVSPGSLRELGIPLVDGRDLEPTDLGDSPLVVVVDQSMARALYGDKRAVGRRAYLQNRDGTPRYYTIVGVAADARHRGRRNDEAGDGVAGDVYFPYAQVSSGQVNLLVRKEPGLAVGTVAQGVVRAAQEIDADVPVFDVATLDERLDRSALIPRFAASLMALYAAAAALLAFVGTYGVLAYAVGERKTELAVRKALGASRAQLLRLVMRQGLLPVAGGLMAGGLASLFLSGPIEGILFGVERSDPAVYVVACGLVALASAVACYLPARRASLASAVAVLRYE